jgi:hypothetical protein
VNDLGVGPGDRQPIICEILNVMDAKARVAGVASGSVAYRELEENGGHPGREK